jgi:hypothetical protein
MRSSVSASEMKRGQTRDLLRITDLPSTKRAAEHLQAHVSVQTAGVPRVHAVRSHIGDGLQQHRQRDQACQQRRVSGCVPRNECVDQRAEDERRHQPQEHPGDRQPAHREHAASQWSQQREYPPPGDGGGIGVHGRMCGIADA